MIVLLRSVLNKFLYLRVAAVAILLIVLKQVGFYIYIFTGEYPPGWAVFKYAAAAGALNALNSMMVLFLYSKFYPNKDIPRWVTAVYYFTVAIGILLIAILSFDDIMRPSAADPMEIALIILLIIQVVGGLRLHKVIRRNARKPFEDSFL